MNIIYAASVFIMGNTTPITTNKKADICALLPMAIRAEISWTWPDNDGDTTIRMNNPAEREGFMRYFGCDIPEFGPGEVGRKEADKKKRRP